MNIYILAYMNPRCFHERSPHTRPKTGEKSKQKLQCIDSFKVNSYSLLATVMYYIIVWIIYEKSITFFGHSPEAKLLNTQNINYQTYWWGTTRRSNMKFVKGWKMWLGKNLKMGEHLLIEHKYFQKWNSWWMWYQCLYNTGLYFLIQSTN